MKPEGSAHDDRPSQRSRVPGSELFPFIQLEFAHSVGPPAGRYVVRAPEAGDEDDDGRDGAAPVVGPDGGPGRAEDTAAEAATAVLTAAPDGLLPLGAADVLIFKVLGAPPPKPKMFRRGLPPQVSEEAPRELSVTLVTAIVSTQCFPGEKDARVWLSALRSDPDALENWVAHGLGMLNRAVGAYRACAADPYVLEVTRADPRAVRVGYGKSTEVVLGDWSQALGVAPPPPPRVTRTVQLMPTQGMAAVLAGQADVLESEELVLRALLDLQHDRPRAAAAGLQAGIELLLGEIAGEVLGGAVQQRVEALVEVRGEADALAGKARRGTLEAAEVVRLREIAERAGDLIDQRRYEPMGF